MLFQSVVGETKDQIIEGLKKCGSEDLWRPMNHLSQADCEKYVADLKNQGFDIKRYVHGKIIIKLSS